MDKVLKNLVLGLVISLTTSGFMTSGVFATEADEITVTYPYYAFVEDEQNPWSSPYDALDATGEIQYSDAYFDEPSPGDHPKLRALSYALALAGFENKSDGYPVELSAVNPKLYGLLDQMGFSDFQSWDIASDNDGLTMGTTIGHKTLASGQKLIVVAPRNYNYMTEWLSNFNVGESGDHEGFSWAANKVGERFDQYISEHEFTDYKVWVVGYSRGGAVIDLFAREINKNIANYDMAPEDFYVYTFGAPRASAEKTAYTNIHDVKDGNDLLLGFLFPEIWGFNNTGSYEEIHPADLEITTSVIDITDLADSSRAIIVLFYNDGLVKEVGTMNGKDFMNEWLQFVNDNGLTREYFNDVVRPPLSAIMQAYQLRHLDKQGEFTEFLSSKDKGLIGMVARNAFADLTEGADPEATIAELLDNFSPYQDLVAIMKGTATDVEIDDFVDHLKAYIGVYDDYVEAYGEPLVSPEEFEVIKENLPELVRALAPIIVADARYTQTTYGENSSLYFTYSLVANAKNLVIGHIPESIMPILKSLIPEEPTDDPGGSGDEPLVVPNTGFINEEEQGSTTEASYLVMVPVLMAIVLFCFIVKTREI